MSFKFFIKEVTARITGDEAGVIAAKNARKAESAIKGQIAALEAKLVDDESRVDDAAETLKTAKFPVNLIRDNQAYVGNIKDAQADLDVATETVEDTKFSIDYFKGLLEEFNAE